VICGLRDYGTATWEGGKNGCDHKYIVSSPYNEGFNERWGNPSGQKKQESERHEVRYRDICKKCGAKRIDNQLGLEKTPEEYVENCVKWARGVWRVLRNDGCFFLNLGDSYATQPASNGISFRRDRAKVLPQSKSKRIPRGSGRWGGGNAPATGHLKSKDLCGMPWKVAFALQAEGWYLRSAMPWVKRSAMPESCTDRPASALEYMFLLTKSSKYFFDMDAIRKEHVDFNRGANGERIGWDSDERVEPGNRVGTGGNIDKAGNKRAYNPAGRNFRNTDLFYQSLEEPHGAIFCGEEMVGLDVNPQAFDIEMCENCKEVYFGKEYRKLKIHVEIKDRKKIEFRICKICKMWDKWLSHFATFPEWLVTPLIKAGTSEKGACPECGAPWERVVENTKQPVKKPGGKMVYVKDFIIYKNPKDKNNEGHYFKTNYSSINKTVGWEPSCACCRKCDIDGTPTKLRSFIHATQRSRERESLAQGLEQEAMGDEHTSQTEGGCPEAEISKDMRPMQDGVQGEGRNVSVLHEELFDEMDVGEQQREQVSSARQKQISTQRRKRENDESSSDCNGKTSGEEIESQRIGTSHKRGQKRQQNRKSKTDEPKEAQPRAHEIPKHEIEPYEPVPCVVLDPFGGSGTTKNVADRLGRRGVMCELKMEYIEMAKKRCYQLPELF